MSRTVDMEKLLAKIAKHTDSSVEELKEAASKSNLYSYDEAVMESQSVLSFYRTRVQARPPERKSGETELAFTKRQREYDAAYRQWRFRTCDECKLEFAYSYHFEGVKYCSLDCLDGALRKIGLRVTRGRPLEKRWGIQAPAIVPSSALKMIRSLSDSSSSNESVAD